MTAAARRRPVILLFAFQAAAACSSAPQAGPQAGARSQSPAPSGERSAAELEAIHRARTDSARLRFTEADVAFMGGMIHHHAQAIEMARLAPTHAASAPIRVLAARIINAQHDEIARMQQWLRDRDRPAPELHITDAHVMVTGGQHGAGAQHAVHMPGMLTAEQMAQLAQARGTAFDRLFLTFMIQHHTGAVAMVSELFATHGAGQDDEIFKLASDVQVDQATEIARMERMLSAMPGGAGSP
jgi:uncharacterized protein (DUF305 family)